MKPTPVGVAQQKVLDALNLTASDWTDAIRKFDEIGITVNSKRVGRSSEPVVSLKETTRGGWNRGGDGESYTVSYKSVDLSAIAQWMS